MKLLSTEPAVVEDEPISDLESEEEEEELPGTFIVVNNSSTGGLGVEHSLCVSEVLGWIMDESNH